MASDHRPRRAVTFVSAKTELPRKLKSANHQYSGRDAVPVKVAYF
jgi:hypothetical protein